MKNKKIWIGITGVLTVIIIGLIITVAMLLLKDTKQDSQTAEKPKKTVEKTVTVDEKEKSKVEKEQASYICELDIPNEKITENGNPYNFKEEFLGWYENQYGAFHLKQIDGENILIDFYILGYKFLQDYSVAIMSEDTFDLTYNEDKANGISSTAYNITINEKDGEIRFFIEDSTSSEHFLEYSLGQNQGMFQELMNYNDVKTEFNLKWYFYGKFTKTEPPETYKEVSIFGEELYDFETGEFIAENTQPVDNREIKERFPKLAKHLPQENWYYTGDLDNKKEVSLIYISTSNESNNGYTNFGLKFVSPSSRDESTNELILHKHINSTYAGSLKIEPQGSFEAWRRMVNQEVLGSKLEVILASALSAVTFDFVNDIFPTENLIISLYGGSSTGKSTALNLAVSTGALPTTTEDSLLLTFLDTENSLMRRMVSGFPIGIDEATTLKKDITRLLYAIANGKERARLTKNLDIVEASEFHTTIFTSSEISIFSLADHNEGLQVRVIELSETWTKDSDSSDEIKRITKSNYGFAIPLLAKYLLKLGTVKVAERCSLWTKRFLECNQAKKVNALYGRLAKKIGIICATAELAEYALGIKFDTTSLMKYFSEQLLSAPESFDCGIQAHNAIIDYVTAHPEEFGKNIPLKESDIYKKNGYFSQASIKTLYDGSMSSTVLHIKKEVFEMILDKNKFRDPKIVLKRLKELGVLVSDKDRYISKFTVAKDGENILVRGYRLYVPNDETPINDEGVTTDGHKMTAHRHRRDTEQETLIKPVHKKRNIEKLRKQAEEKWEESRSEINI